MNEFEIGHHTQDSLTLEASQEHHFQRPNVVTDETAKAKMVTYLKRVFKAHDENHISYDVWLGVGGSEPKHHLHCDLTRL